MAAYRLWTGVAEKNEFICEFDWPEHSVVGFNNYRILHGRASVPPNMERTMCFGYNMKTIVENRYRFLRQTLAEKKNPLMTDKWLTRLPNQVEVNGLIDSALDFAQLKWEVFGPDPPS